MRFQLAVFDMDGTVLNTVDDLAAAGNFALRECGLPEHTTEVYKQLAGGGINKLVQWAIPYECRNDNALTTRVQSLFNEYYEAHGQDFTRPYPGIPELLAALRDAGMYVAVLSNKPHRFVPSMAEHYFPGFFNMTLGQRDGVPIKPDPQALLEIMRHFEVPPARCAYIGDSDVDIRTAKAANVVGIGVSWGFRTRKELESSGASYIVDNSEALQKILVDKRENVRYTGN